jgi:hypothetical protein
MILAAKAPRGWGVPPMAYDPMLTSAILVGLVGGIAAFLNITSDWEITRELVRATDTWTAPLVVRIYPDDSTAQERVAREAALLLGHGYKARLQRGGSDDLVIGSAAALDERIILPGTHANGEILITYWRA